MLWNSQYVFHHKRTFRTEDFMNSGVLLTWWAMFSVFFYFCFFFNLRKREKEMSEQLTIYCCYNIHDNRNWLFHRHTRTFNVTKKDKSMMCSLIKKKERSNCWNIDVVRGIKKLGTCCYKEIFKFRVQTVAKVHTALCNTTPNAWLCFIP